VIGTEIVLVVSPAPKVTGDAGAPSSSVGAPKSFPMEVAVPSAVA
jgi:hypothetical protein